MKPEEAAAATASKSGSSAVAFSWEQEPGVSKESPAEAVSRRTPASVKKQQAPAKAHPHRLRVPPPPGGPGAPAASPPGTRKPRSRRVRPAEDPFLAAYLACTEEEDGGRGYKGAQKLLGWAGLGLGLGFGLRGLGLSCRTSCGVVEECVIRLAKIPGVDED